MSLADRCGIITTLDQSVPRIRRKITGRGFSGRFPSIRPLGIPVLEYDQKEKVTQRALEVARQMVVQEGIEALILGCGSLFGIKEQMQQELMIPVVEPGTVTLKHAEALVTLGLCHSKKSYMVPLPVNRPVRIGRRRIRPKSKRCIRLPTLERQWPKLPAAPFAGVPLTFILILALADPEPSPQKPWPGSCKNLT
jgi:hypothetical protein